MFIFITFYNVIAKWENLDWTAQWYKWKACLLNETIRLRYIIKTQLVTKRNFRIYEVHLWTRTSTRKID